MKSFFIVVFIIFSTVSFAQETREAKVVVKDSIYTKADQAPEYQGGLMKFRQDYMNNFDTSLIKGKGEIACELSFVVLENGTITDIQSKGNDISFNNEAQRAFQSLKKVPWTPAKINGEPVKFRFKMPLNMRFAQ